MSWTSSKFEEMQAQIVEVGLLPFAMQGVSVQLANTAPMFNSMTEHSSMFPSFECASKSSRADFGLNQTCCCHRGCLCADGTLLEVWQLLEHCVGGRHHSARVQKMELILTSDNHKLRP